MKLFRKTVRKKEKDKNINLEKSGMLSRKWESGEWKEKAMVRELEEE